MGLSVGPTPWWQNNLIHRCPVGTSLLDGSRIICKSGGTAWIVAPYCTEVSSSWAGGQYNTTVVGDKCCICEWSGLENQLIDCGFNPCDWFIPSFNQMCNPGYVCRSNWDCFQPGSDIGCAYWSSTEFNAICACYQCTNCVAVCTTKGSCSLRVRAFRCVTY